MNISVNALSYHYIPIDAPPPSPTVILDFLEFAHQLGVGGVDLEDRLFASTEQDYLLDVRARADVLGLKLLSLGMKIDFSIIPDHDSTEAEIARAERWVDVAAHLGVPLLRLAGNGFKGAEDPELVWELITEKFRRVVAYAQRAGVAVGLHNHNHGAVPSTAPQVHRLLDNVPGLQLILDVGQFVGSPGAGAAGQNLPPQPATDELYEHIRGVASRAHTIRTKFYVLKQVDLQLQPAATSVTPHPPTIARAEELLLDYERIFQILKEAQFAGWLSIVYEGKTTGSDFTSKGEEVSVALPMAVQRLRRGISEGGSTARSYKIVD